MHELTDEDSGPKDVKEANFCQLKKYTVGKSDYNVVKIVRWLDNFVVTVASFTFSQTPENFNAIYNYKKET